MPLMGFAELFLEADARPARTGVAAAGGADETVLRALREAADRGWVEPILTGRGDEIGRVADAAGVSLEGMSVLDTEEPARAAVRAVSAGRARLLMKGQVATPALMRAVLDPEIGLRTGRVIGQVVLMEIAPHRRRFLMVDTGVCVAPSLEQKRDLLASAVAVARTLGEPEPRVALMAATETVTEAMPETLDAAELQRQCAAGDLPGCRVQGPLSFDLAYAADAGEKKRVGGEVVGAADVLLFPNLLAANLTVKAIMYTAPCRFGGVLCGTASPVVFMSRADRVETRLNSMALALAIINDNLI